MSASDVILYRYDISPRSKKVDNILLFKGIKHSIVNVAPLPPRPEITELLGVTYRQIPILAIGNDVYCDSSLIASALERRFPDRSIFSARKGDSSASDRTSLTLELLSRHVAGLLPWDKVPQALKDDRVKFFGMDPAAAIKAQPHNRSQLASLLGTLEEQLSDCRQWLFDTQEPSLADLSVHYCMTWANSLGESALLAPEKLPNLAKWFSQMDEHLNSLKAEFGSPVKIDGEAASRAITSAKWEDYDVVGFDTGALSSGLKAGDNVSVSSTQVREHNPTVGKLVALNAEEIVVEVTGQSGLIRCHFPRYGFAIQAVE